MEKIVFKLENITKNFGGIRALDNVDFELRKGEIHALVGENGAGKSTLIKIMTGVHKADSGVSYLNGDEVHIDSTIAARKKGIGAIYQELSLIESLNVAENIFLGNEPVRLFGVYDKKKLHQDAKHYLDFFGIDIDSHAKISDLGMGQKRVIEIIKALALDAQVLILDEPTTGMSQGEIDILFKILNNLKEKEVTMIYISHYLEEVFAVCDRVTVLKDGVKVDTFDVSSVDNDTLIRAMVGKELKGERLSTNHSLEDKAKVLELRSLQTGIMKHPISFTVRESEILGITGVVGAGKSELAHSIFGNGGSATGEIFIDSELVEMNNTTKAKAYKMAFIPEDRKTQGLFLDETIENNLTITNLQKIASRAGTISSKKRRAFSNEVGESIGVKPLNVLMSAKNLSGGNQQKVVIGKWLAVEPEIIIMDEPTRGIDVGAKDEIYKLIVEFSQENKSVIILSSEFEELMRICDRIIVLKEGRIVGEVVGSEATNEKLLNMAIGNNKNAKNK